MAEIEVDQDNFLKAFDEGTETETVKTETVKTKDSFLEAFDSFDAIDLSKNRVIILSYSDRIRIKIPSSKHFRDFV